MRRRSSTSAKTKTLDAVYRHGLIKPRTKLPFRENSTADAIIRDAAECFEG